MKRTALILIFAFCVAPAYSVEFAGAWRPLRGASYLVFSGDELSDRDAPTSKDRKLSISIEGRAAKEIFDSIGPDSREMCSSEKGDRERDKGGVQCSYTAKDAAKPGMGYRCWIGVNLVTGRSIPTVAC